jgi:Spy/CpxP family protein refolding chaperone
MGGRHMMGAGEGQMMGPMLDAAGVTPQQRAQVTEIMTAARTEMQAQRQANRALREQVAQLLAAPQLDASAIEAARQRMLEQHNAMSKRMTKALVDAAAVLTPEQRQKAAAHVSARRDMMERHRRERDALMPWRGA